MEEFFNQSRKDFLELYVYIAGAEDVVLSVRSVALNSSCHASTSAAYASPEFATKKEVRMALKINLMREHQDAIVIEITPTKLSMKYCAHDKGCLWQGHRQLDTDVIAELVLDSVARLQFFKPVIQIDGTHLYGKYKGKLLVAMAQDGNDECLPLAFANVEGETLEAWDYFLVNIRAYVTQMSNICLISEWHRSIISAVENNLNCQPPNAYHVFCLRHIASNFNQKFMNERLKRKLKNLGYTPSVEDFERGFARFPQVAEWIDAISKKKWTRAYDVEGCRYGHMTTNLAESVNKVLKGKRNMPITALVKHIYNKLIHYFVNKGQAVASQLQSTHRHCQNIVRLLKHNEHLARGHHVRAYNVDQTVFEVDEGWDKSYSVDLPESHIAAATLSVRQNPFQYVDDIFLTTNLVQAYSFPWKPIGNEEAIPPSAGPMLIPETSMLRAKGRPRSTRIRDEMDEVETSQNRIRCGICKQHGHNRRGVLIAKRTIE
ncbi:uncharacterized protein LOC133308881 [Gastrolobium bilobum]|uniref:uncharacterized protein LOC133308881 n=1 Tax=Gastrolobium bilobum TaxID=150636 RepID=UPI002AB180A2|nr:uncharacterized protein LOC133308881 [Gastrolobium bilobum]